eukprot:scaffold7738_cov107-Isochrysis_galbana.AAC.17
MCGSVAIDVATSSSMCNDTTVATGSSIALAAGAASASAVPAVRASDKCAGPKGLVPSCAAPASPHACPPSRSSDPAGGFGKSSSPHNSRTKMWSGGRSRSSRSCGLARRVVAPSGGASIPPALPAHRFPAGSGTDAARGSPLAGA